MEASGLIGSESKDLRTKGADDLNASLRAGEDEKRYPSSNHETEKRDKDKAIICKGCVCVPGEYKNINQKTNKNSEFVTGVQKSF